MSRLSLKRISEGSFRFLLILFVLVAFAHWASASSFEIHGRIDVTSYRDKNAAPKSGTRSFNLSIGDCGVRIHVDSCSLDKGIEFREFGTDGGEESFYLVKFSSTNSPHIPANTPNEFTNKVDLNKLRSANDSSFVARKSMSPPPVQGGAIIPVWYAYGSRCYFSNRSDQFVECLANLGDVRLLRRIDSLRLRADWTREVEAPHFLSEYCDYRDIRIVDQGRTYPAPTDISTGVTNSRFTVLNWTNVSGLRFPSEFTYHLYLPSEVATGPNVRLVASWHGFAHSVSVGSESGHFVPQLTTATRVVDYRYPEFSGKTPADYLTTNQTMLSRDELLKRLEEKKRRLQLSKPTDYRKIFLATIIAISAALPVTLFAVRVVKQTKQNKTKQ